MDIFKSVNGGIKNYDNQILVLVVSSQKEQGGVVLILPATKMNVFSASCRHTSVEFAMIPTELIVIQQGPATYISWPMRRDVQETYSNLAEYQSLSEDCRVLNVALDMPISGTARKNVDRGDIFRNSKDLRKALPTILESIGVKTKDTKKILKYAVEA